MTTFITREELRAALDSLTVVDALPPAPYGQRHLPGAVNLVAEDSDQQVAGALPGKAAAIVTYSTDAGCPRGPALAARLQALGYSDVRTFVDYLSGAEMLVARRESNATSGRVGVRLLPARHWPAVCAPGRGRAAAHATRRTAFATSGTCHCTSCPCTSAAPCARGGSARSLPRHDR